MTEAEQHAIAALDVIKAAQEEKRRAYHRDYYAKNKEAIKANMLRRAYEQYTESQDKEARDD